MAGWQPQQYDPGQQPGAVSPQGYREDWQHQALYGPQQYGQPPQYGQVQPHVPQSPAVPFSAPSARGLTGAQQFWYVLQCIAFGAGYFSKIPAKKALADFGMAEMTGAEKFWYVLQCVAFGAGYFAKLPVAKALSEMPQFQTGGYR
jgi:hypothetical protein